MKKNYHLMILAAALALCAVSCGKEEPATPDQPVIDNGEGNEDNNGSATPGGDVTLVPYSFTVDGTKTYINGSNVAWEDGESIAVYDGTAIREFTMASAEGPVFSGVIADNATYAWAVYPYASEGISATETSVTAAIPSGQTLSGQNAAKGALLTAGKIDLDNNTVTLLNLHGLVSVTIGHDDITQVSVSGTGLAGTATFSFDATGALSQATPTSVTSSVDKVTLTPDGETFTKGSTYYVAALPGAKISSVSVKRTDGFEASKEVTGEKTLTRNAGFAAGTLDDTALDWVYNVSSADELMAWAEVNSGTWENANGEDDSWADAYITASTSKYANAANHTVKLTADIDMSGKTWTPQTLYCNFDGGNHAITKIVVEQANNSTFFQTLEGSASVKDVTFGASGDGSAFTVTSIASGQSDVYAAPIGQTNGSSSVENVTNYAAVSFSSDCGGLNNNGNYNSGGIVGNHKSTGSISSCKNYGTVSNYASASQTSGVSNYIGLGGVCGGVRSSGNVTSCENHAAVLFQSDARPTTANVGGVVGYVNGTSTISSCNNSGIVTIDNSSAGSFNANIGGVAGYVQTGAATLKSCNNLAGGDVTISGSKTGVTNIGGIVGRNNNAAATYTSCTNVAGVNVTYTPTAAITLYAAGGVGYVDGAAAPSFAGCSNSGKVNIAYTSSYGGTPSIGGFAGTVTTTNSTSFSECSNSGEVNTSYSATSANNYIGGFIGNIQTSAPTLTSCSNSGAVKIAHTSTGGGNVMAGGVAGRIAMESTELSSCNNSGEITFAPSIKNSSWSHIGGIVGELNANSIKLSSCTSTGNITNTTSISNLRLGGIVGVSENNSYSGMTVDGCTAEGITISCAKAEHVGGLVGYVSSLSFSGTNNTIKNVTLSTTGTVTNAAILVGRENQASTLTGNKVSGSVLGTALTADNFTSYLYNGTAPSDNSNNTFISE